MFGIKYKPKNLTESLLPILIVNWIAGHQLINYPLEGFNFLQSFIYLSFVVIIYSNCLYFSINYLLVVPWFAEMVYKYLIIVGVTTVTSGIIIILGWILKKKSKIIDIRNRNLDKKIEELGLKIDIQEAFNFSLIITIAWTINVLLMNLIASWWVLGTENSLKNVAAMIATYHPFYIHHLVNSTFSLSIRHMGLRFKVLNQAITKFEIKENLTISNFLYDKRRISNNRANEFRDTPSYLNHLLQIFREIHLELTKLCGKTTQLYGFQVFLIMLSLSILITTTFYQMYLTTTDDETSGDTRKIFIYNIYIASHCLNFLFVNHFCSKTIAEWKRTGEIIHKLEVQSQNTELCLTIQQFSLQISQNPLTISPCGFIELGYSFVQSFVGTITTYLVILIQMSPRPIKIIRIEEVKEIISFPISKNLKEADA